MQEFTYTEPTFVITPAVAPARKLPPGAEEKIENIGGVNYDYAIYPLVDSYSSVLSVQTPHFNFIAPPIDPRYLAVSLVKTMIKNHGVGLAAPQIGLCERVFVMGAGDKAFACFNPEILESSGQDDFEEGCLSFKGLFLRIRRPDTIKVRFTDMNGQPHKETFNGFTARIFQHELDHLNGIVYTSLVNPYVLNKAKTKVKANIKKLNAQYFAQKKQQIIEMATKKVIAEQKIKDLQESIQASMPDTIMLINPEQTTT